MSAFAFVLILAVFQAGRSVPPLMEGDQVLLINGRDISEHTHEQVVMFIKASRESHSKELALLVRRKGEILCNVQVYVRATQQSSLVHSFYIITIYIFIIYIANSLCTFVKSLMPHVNVTC